VGLLE
jgi:hypothetical protein